MRTTHSIFLAVSTLIVGIGLGAQGAKTTTYADGTYGFKIDLPPNTQPIAKDSQALIAQFLSTPKDGFATNINIFVERAATTRDAYIANKKKEIATMGGKLVGEKPRTVNGWDAVELDWTAPLQGNTMHWLALAVILKEESYLVMSTSLERNYAANEKALRASLQTFAVDTPNPAPAGK